MSEYINCGTGSFQNKIYYKRNKYMTTIRCRIALDSATALYIAAYSVSSTVGQLPSGARPSIGTIIPIHGREVNTAEILLALFIDANGTITIQNATNTNYYITSIEADCCYIN
jgi:hypothetical protein